MLGSKDDLEFGKELTFHETTIPGLLIADLPVHGDSRGWFKENFQKEKMVKLGLPNIDIVQNSMSFNNKKGVTRGIHAEPWDKFISVGSGSFFGAWVDLREGDSFGKVFTAEINPSKAIYVPRGVGNSFQTLEDNLVYTYLVNDHWSAESQSKYTFLNLADETINIKWPIPLSQAEISDKDKNHPRLADVVPMKPKRTLITGSNGQLGRALQVKYPDAEFTDYMELDITSPDLENARPWNQYKTIINAAGYTAVDKAETPEGREAAWRLNAFAVANLGKVASKYNLTLVHISTDYVFDGTKPDHTEDEQFSPLGVYAQTKAAGDIAASMVPKHYITRTSWVIGDGNNFVRTMQSLAEKDVKPSVVNDQVGRLTFTGDLARSIKHLIDIKAPYGTYNITGDGESASWADIAADVYELAGHSRDEITGVSTTQYYEGKSDISPRPLQSALSLDKIKATGFIPTDWRQSLKVYLDKEGVKGK
jgi:dTDP-4-dehydrorhamnose 3,5-epimerase